MKDGLVRLILDNRHRLSFCGVLADDLQQWLNSRMPLETLFREMPLESLLPDSVYEAVSRPLEISPKITYDPLSAQSLPKSRRPNYSYGQMLQRHVDSVRESEEKLKRDIQKSAQAAAAVQQVDTSWYKAKTIRMTWNKFLEKISDGCQLDYYDEVDILKWSSSSDSDPYKKIFGFLFARAKKESPPSGFQLMEIGVIEIQAREGGFVLDNIFRGTIFKEKRESMGEGVLFTTSRQPSSLFHRERRGPVQKYHDDLGSRLVNNCLNLWEVIREVRAYKIFLRIEEQVVEQPGCIPRPHMGNERPPPDENARIYIRKLLEDGGNKQLLPFVNFLMEEKNNGVIVGKELLKNAKTCEEAQKKVFRVVLDRLLELKMVLFYVTQENPVWRNAFSFISDIIEGVSKITSSQSHTQEPLAMLIRERLKGFQMVFRSFLDEDSDLYRKLDLLLEFNHLKQFFKTESFDDWVPTFASAPAPPPYELARECKPF